MIGVDIMVVVLVNRTYNGNMKDEIYDKKLLTTLSKLFRDYDISENVEYQLTPIGDCLVVQRKVLPFKNAPKEWYVASDGSVKRATGIEYYSDKNIRRQEFGNMFMTKEDAEMARNEIREVLK